MLMASATLANLPARSTPSPMATTHRMLQLGTGWFPERKGGAENMYWNLLPQLARNGFVVHGVVPGSAQAEHDSGGLVRSYDPAGLSLPQRFRAIRRAAAPAFAAGIDVAGAHFALYALPLLDQLARQPFVMHFHGPWAMESLAEGSGTLAAAAKRAIERLVYARADRLIVLSDAFGGILRDTFGVPAERIRRIPGGVDCVRFASDASRAEARGLLGWETDRPILLAVRRLVRRMGLGTLIEAMTLLPAAQRDAVLCIVGQGPERGPLEAQAAALGLASRIRFTGSLPDALLPIVYRAADLTVMPSEALEGFGLAAAESLAAGTPVMVTPVGGLPDIVAGLSQALLLPGRDAAAIAAGLAEALAHPARLPDAAACAAHARVEFDWTTIGARTATVYRDLL